MNKSQTYPTHVYWDERDAGFIAIAPDLPGCSAFGETREEALKELELAICAWIETAIAAGEPVPEPTPIPKPSNYSGKVLLRIPSSLHERLAKDAEAQGVSLNQWMVTLLASGDPLRMNSPRFPDFVDPRFSDSVDAYVPRFVVFSHSGIEASSENTYIHWQRKPDRAHFSSTASSSTWNLDFIILKQTPKELANG